MEQRLREITAAVDLILDELERIRPATCQDAVDLNWRIRKLAIARGLMADSLSGIRRASSGRSAPQRHRTGGLGELRRTVRVE